MRKIKSSLRRAMNAIRIKKAVINPKKIGRFDLINIIKVVGKLDNLLFLDVGCGFGEECAVAHSVGLKVIGYDVVLYPEMEDVVNVYPNISISIGNINKLDEVKPDIIMCNHVLEHVEDDVQMLDYFYKKLNHGGVLLISVPPLINIKTLLYRSMGIQKFSDKTHCREYSVEEITQKLKRSKFDICSVNTSGLGLPIPGLPLLLRIIDKNRNLDDIVPDIFFLHDSINIICKKV